MSICLWPSDSVFCCCSRWHVYILSFVKSRFLSLCLTSSELRAIIWKLLEEFPSNVSVVLPLWDILSLQLPHHDDSTACSRGGKRSDVDVIPLYLSTSCIEVSTCFFDNYMKKILLAAETAEKRFYWVFWFHWIRHKRSKMCSGGRVDIALTPHQMKAVTHNEVIRQLKTEEIAAALPCFRNDKTQAMN